MTPNIASLIERLRECPNCKRNAGEVCDYGGGDRPDLTTWWLYSCTHCGWGAEAGRSPEEALLLWNKGSHLAPIPAQPLEAAAKALHEEFCRQNVMAYLDFEFDCHALARVALINAFPTLDAELSRLQSQIELLEGERDEAHGIVDRIWSLFGNPSYEDLAGRSIYDLITELQHDCEQAEADRDAAFARGMEKAAGIASDAFLTGDMGEWDKGWNHAASTIAQRITAAIRSAISSTDQTSEGKSNG